MAPRRSLAQLGMHWDTQPRTAQADTNGKRAAHLKAVDSRLDHFVERDGMVYAGTHLILDLWGARNLDDLGHIEDALRECVVESGATLLHIHLHHFTPNGGVSGVAVLAESHISIHTWPERDYAALDIFMCGDARPHEAIPVLRRAFEPEKLLITEQKRGCIG